MFIKIEISGDACWFYHRWKTEKQEGITTYQRCKDCQAKRITQPDGGYQLETIGNYKGERRMDYLDAFLNMEPGHSTETTN